MEEIVLLDAVERYLDGEMTAQEKSYFEDLRRSNSEVDQLVVEHQFFLNQVNNYAGQKEFKALLNETHNQLVADGTITQNQSKGGRVIRLWNKNRRTIAVAASIACVTALTISGMLSYISPKAESNNQELIKLGREIRIIKAAQQQQSLKIQEINGNKTPVDETQVPLIQRSAGSSFLIDTKGYLVTNSHVIANAKAIMVSNNGHDYQAAVVYDNPTTDMAVLKIIDPEYVAPSSLPYSIRKSGTALGEPIFTLGYPRNLITYGQGYLSALSGFDDDSLSVQISISANPGNSGGPIFDKNGDVIGILSSREKNADGVVFANKASNIVKMLEQLRAQDTSYNNIKLPTKNSLRGKETTQQIEQIKSCVFMVKAFSK